MQYNTHHLNPLVHNRDFFNCDQPRCRAATEMKNAMKDGITPFCCVPEKLRDNAAWLISAGLKPITELTVDGITYRLLDRVTHKPDPKGRIQYVSVSTVGGKDKYLAGHTGYIAGFVDYRMTQLLLVRWDGSKPYIPGDPLWEASWTHTGSVIVDTTG